VRVSRRAVLGKALCISHCDQHHSGGTNFPELRLLASARTGVVLDCPNSALAAHIAEFIEAQELDSSTALLERLRSAEQDPSTLPSLLDGAD